MIGAGIAEQLDCAFLVAEVPAVRNGFTCKKVITTAGSLIVELTLERPHPAFFTC
jgi:hypothetical protein